MKIIEYSWEGIAYPDSKAESAARTLFSNDFPFHVMVSTENFITAARALIHEGVIPHTKVEFRFGEYVLRPNRNGRLEDWPEGFCDYGDGWLDRLLVGMPDKTSTTKSQLYEKPPQDYGPEGSLP